MATIRPGPPLSREDLLAVVVRKGGKDLLPTNAEVQKTKDQRFHAELVNLGISCGGALLSWVTTIVSGAAAPVTGGLSLIITFSTGAATYAGIGQCGVAAFRVGAELYNPQVNIDMDNWEIYQLIATGMDVVGLAGALGSAASITKAVYILKGSTGKSMVDIIKGLSRQERKRLTEEILRSTNPGLSNTKMKMMRLAKPALKRFTPKAVSDGIRKQLMDAVGAMGNVGGSALSGTINQAFSGPDGDYIVGLVSAYELD
jgi:hypothetical protein